MVILISGASHTGKTMLAQKLLEKYGMPYLSIDLLKMGLIRSGKLELMPEEDEKLKIYLWSVVRETVKTAIENSQNLIVEGIYIPFSWKNDFDDAYQKEIKQYCLVMTRAYIEQHFKDIKRYANVVEKRLDDTWFTKEYALENNAYYFEMCQKYSCNYILIDKDYHLDIEL